jgi:amidase
MGELWAHGAGELAAMIAGKEVSSVEVVEAHLARIEAVNPALNAVTRVLAVDARAAALAADQALAAGEPLGALHGVPFTVKQNIDLVGSSTNWGLPAFADALPTTDSPVVERMKGAGAIPIGRTNCPDMALRVHTDSALYGLTRNPWNLGHTTGGSSGGEAAALATGMSPIGLGNDIGGSLRNPATCCGIASIKPSAGRVPLYTTIPSPDGPLSFQVMPVEGPMARTIADVRLGLDVMSGRDWRDPYSMPLTPAPAPPKGRPLRMSVVAEPPGGSTHPGVVERTRAAATALAAAGYEVVEIEPPRFVDVFEVWTAFILNDIRGLLGIVGPLMSADANAFLNAALESYPPLDLAGFNDVIVTRQTLMREWAHWFVDIDLLLTPCWTQLPFAHGWDVESPEQSLETLEMMRCVMPANVLGLPSACVPAGLVDGLPVGVLLTGDHFADDTTLTAASVVEAALAPATPIDPVS